MGGTRERGNAGTRPAALISSTKNPLVKRIKGLGERAQRDAEQRMVIEGLRLLEEALAARAPVELLLYDRTAERDRRAAALLARAREDGIRLVAATSHVLAACSQVETPQGLLAVVPLPQADLTGILDAPDLVLAVVDRVQDPGNLGVIVRVADAAGATAVAVTAGSVDPHNPKAIRATMGSLFHLPVVEVDGGALVGELRRRGVHVLVADPRGTVAYTAVSYRRPLAVVLGGEAEGPDPAWEAIAEAVVRIPIYGRAESLNVASAAALLLYEAQRWAGRAAPAGEEGGDGRTSVGASGPSA